MSGQAQVRSIDAVERFNQALSRYRQRSSDALDALEGELRRIVDWLEHDRPAYWRVQIRKAEDGVHQAKMELERCLMFPTVEGERPACREEKDALKQAQARLAHCREKVELVQRWKRTMQHEIFEYQGRMGSLRQVLEVDLLRAHEALQQILRRVEAYMVEQGPAMARESRSDVDRHEDNDGAAQPAPPRPTSD